MPQTHPPSWKPLGRKAPTQWRPPKQLSKRLSKSHLAFIGWLEQIAREGTEDELAQAINALEAVPRQERLALDLVALQSRILSRMGQHNMAYAVIFDQLFAFESELLWLDRGKMIEEWLKAYPNPTEPHLLETRQGLLSQLERLCQQSTLMTPRLLLCFALGQGQERPPAEALAWLPNVLDASRWRSFELPMGPWLSNLAGGFFAYIEHLLQEQDIDTAQRLGRQILSFKWQQSKQLTPNDLHLLCLALLQLNMLREQKRLCERVQEALQARKRKWGEPSFWLGRLALREGDGKRAAHYFQKALDSGEMNDSQRRSIARGLLQLGTAYTDAAKAALAQLTERNAIETLQLEALLALYQNDLEAGLAHCKAILEREPNDKLAALHQVSILVGLGRFDEAEQQLQPWSDHVDLALQLFAHLLLGDIYLQRDIPETARQHFAKLLQPPLSFDVLLDPDWQRGFLLSYGESLVRTGQIEEALRRYREAYELRPSIALRNRILWLLLQQGKHEEAARLADDEAEATSDGTSSPWYLLARAHLAEHKGDWQSCKALVEELGWAWLESHELHQQMLGTYLRALLVTTQPWDAIVFCEQHLNTIIKEPTLRALRDKAINAMDAQLKELHTTLGQQTKQLDAMDNLRAELIDELNQKQQQADYYQQILQQQRDKELRLEPKPMLQGASVLTASHWHAGSTSQTLDAPTPSWLRQYAALFDVLPTNTKAIFRSAAMLWERVLTQQDNETEQTKEDHAPIVIQLARVVESEVNRLLIDPLVKHAIDSDFSLQDFPEVKSSRLMAQKNRISVNDASYLLYHTLEVPEKDGSTSTQRNPRSHERHREILETYWSHAEGQRWSEPQRHYIQHQLPLDLQRLSKHRNPASHASAEQPPPISRREANDVQKLILGDAQRPGILWHLLQPLPN